MRVFRWCRDWLAAGLLGGILAGGALQPGRLLAFDVMVLVDDPRPLKCRVDGLGDDFLVARVAIETREGTTTERRSIKLGRIAFIDFEMADAEAALLASPEQAALAELRDLWESKSKWLRVPRSNAGEAGLAVAGALLAGGDAARAAVALDTFRMVEDGDWNESRRALAQQGRLRALLALGRPEEALAEARVVAESAEDPAILVETRLVMAEAARRKFEAAVEESPKWREDDEVRDAVMRQFQDTIDQFLYPSLFHGFLEEPAALGLWSASEVYRLAGDGAAARACAQDLVALYPETAHAEQARQFLQDDNEPEDAGANR